MAEVFVSAVNAADTSDAATSVSRAITMTKSLAEGLVTQAAAGKTIISSAAAQNGTVTITLVDAVVTDALVSAVQAYTADAAITDTSLDTLASEADALKAFATDVTVLVTHLTDQLNFSDVTGTAAEGAITSAKSSADQALTTLVTAVTGASASDLVTYGTGDSSSSIVAAVNTLKTDLGVDSSTGGGSSGGGSSDGGSSGGGSTGGGSTGGGSTGGGSTGGGSGGSGSGTISSFEGRVIDGPVSGATVFIDVDGDYVQDSGEPNGTTDISGLYSIATGGVTTSSTSKLISIGGTDTTTNKALPDLVLVADVPTTASVAANITPISTIVAAATTPAAKVEVLTSLGISAADLQTHQM